MPVAVQLVVEDNAWATLVQLVVWGMFEVHGTVMVVVGGFEILWILLRVLLSLLSPPKIRVVSSNSNYMY